MTWDYVQGSEVEVGKHPCKGDSKSTAYSNYPSPSFSLILCRRVQGVHVYVFDSIFTQTGQIKQVHRSLGLMLYAKTIIKPLVFDKKAHLILTYGTVLQSRFHNQQRVFFHFRKPNVHFFHSRFTTAETLTQNCKTGKIYNAMESLL